MASSTKDSADKANKPDSQKELEEKLGMTYNELTCKLLEDRSFDYIYVAKAEELPAPGDLCAAENLVTRREVFTRLHGYLMKRMCAECLLQQEGYFWSQQMKCLSDVQYIELVLLLLRKLRLRRLNVVDDDHYGLLIIFNTHSLNDLWDNVATNPMHFEFSTSAQGDMKAQFSFPDNVDENGAPWDGSFKIYYDIWAK